MFLLNYKKPTFEEEMAVKSSLLSIGTLDRKTKRRILMPCILTFYKDNKAVYSIKTNNPRSTYKDIIRGRTTINSKVKDSFNKVGLIVFKNSHYVDIVFPIIELNKKPIINESVFKEESSNTRYYKDDIDFLSKIDSFDLSIKEIFITKETFESWI